MNLFAINPAIFLAYLDPGSGSILIQVLISALVGIGFFVRAKWGQIKSIFRKNPPETQKEKVEDEDFDV